MLLKESKICTIISKKILSEGCSQGESFVLPKSAYNKTVIMMMTMRTKLLHWEGEG